MYETDEPDSDDPPVKCAKTFLDDTEDFDFNNSDTEELVSTLDTNPSDPTPDTEDTAETPAPPVPAPAPKDPAPDF